MRRLTSYSLLLALLFVTGSYATTTTISYMPTATAQPIPTALWGHSFEDVNHAGDGGLYAELLRNRAFQQVTPGTPASLDAWHAVGGTNLTVIADPIPVSAALPNAIQVTFPAGKLIPIGLGNEGWFGGLHVDLTKKYTASFFYRFPQASNFSGNAAVGFQTASGLSLGTTSVPIKGSQTTWLQVTTTITPSKAPPNNNNWFSITLSGPAAAGLTINFAMLSLFPPTFANRVNGLSPSLVSAVQQTGPGFLRFPGGNNLGNMVNQRWRWNQTVGRLVDRPGRIGSWGYVNTDGLGLLEFLQFCEDIAIKPVMAVYSGLSLDGVSVNEGDLSPFIQEAIDQINFAIGPATTVPGALRVALGHPGPFSGLTQIEVGNKDFMASDTYVTRWQDFVGVLSLNFPQLDFIASSIPNNPALQPVPLDWDVQAVQSPQWLASNSFFYDTFPRDGTVYFEGAYAGAFTTDSNGNNNTLPFPTLQSAIDEAAFMTGLERNSDIVIGASYAPLFNNVGSTQLSPSLISFDITNIYLSTSFLVQQLFSTNKGDHYIPSSLPDPNGNVFWSIVHIGGQHLIKLVNTGGSNETVILQTPTLITFASTTLLTGASGTSSNNPTTPSAVVPVSGSVSNTGTQFIYVAPPLSLTLLRTI